ncbi:hypothetical protein L228DRAFT_163712 [Xylona heveae TC161]|uniref:Uncharacterized protein n=1 Tax=Xylona heveae (strain CBS 132557 / TC161) TaxID=1328760 RepID=A0A165GA13_XYLHT|nr:hypothetical protein L228DRAFT_163712 [Xylona heveae TC161]KZF21930.1 hypothetical protein L228DRAFT_163712 [Xylona heveae TC161]
MRYQGHQSTLTSRSASRSAGQEEKVYILSSRLNVQRCGKTIKFLGAQIALLIIGGVSYFTLLCRSFPPERSSSRYCRMKIVI